MTHSMPKKLTIVGFCGKWDSARAHLQAWLLDDAGTGMKRMEVGWNAVRYYQTLESQGAWTAHFNRHCGLLNMTETQLQAAIIELAGLNGLAVLPHLRLQAQRKGVSGSVHGAREAPDLC